MTGNVFDIKRFAIHDGPGIRTSVFLKGCPLNCLWCQNPEGIPLKPVLWYFRNRCIKCSDCIAVCPENALSADHNGVDFIRIDHERCTLCGKCTEVCPGTALSVAGKERDTEWVIAEVLKDRVFYERSGGGATLTGGDPVFQHEFSISILKALKAEGIHTAVETSMYAREDILMEFIPVTDLFLVDLKMMDEALHREYTGVGNSLIKSNFIRLAENKEDIIVRVPLIPGYTAVRENLEETGKFVRGVRRDIKIELLNFNPLARDKFHIINRKYPLPERTSSFSEEEMDRFYSFIQS